MLQQSPWEPNPYLDRALRNYQAAVSWNPSNAHAWRKLGEVYLTLGQNEPARDALTRALALEPDRHLYQVLLGDAYDGLGASQEALAAWTAGRGGTLRRDAILVNGAKIASAHIDAGDPLSAVPVLTDTVLRFDPDNLFALATVVTAYDSAVDGEHPLADPYREAARFPSRAALQPGSDPRLTEYQAKGALQLFRAGYWSEEMVYEVARYWAGMGNPAAILLTQALREADPQRLEWLLLEAEALIRAGRVVEALDVLPLATADLPLQAFRLRAAAQVQAARSLGRGEYWTGAVESLESYVQAAPEDLWPLAALVEGYQQVGQDLAAAAAAKELSRRTEGADVAAAAAVLGVPTSSLVLGGSLVPNGGFEDWSDSEPVGWTWSGMVNRKPWAPGLYDGGCDSLLGLYGCSIWVQGVWTSKSREEEPARAGYWLSVSTNGESPSLALSDGSQYVVSLDYLVEESGQPTATLWLSTSEAPCWRNDLYLSPTAGEWRHATWVCKPVAEGDDPLRPLLRLFGTGRAMFDNFQIREVMVSPVGKEG